MTNQEAIASLRTLCHTCELFPKCVHEKPECFQAIELAISALEAQEVKNSNQEVKNSSDLISREMALKESHQIVIDGDAYDVVQVETLIALPSAQPEIIRCKDCKHAIEDSLCGGYWCNGKAVTSYHFCGYAERRTDE